MTDHIWPFNAVYNDMEEYVGTHCSQCHAKNYYYLSPKYEIDIFVCYKCKFKWTTDDDKILKEIYDENATAQNGSDDYGACEEEGVPILS
jgi:Zn ribbon nucleic-acid-binding protein